jgi:hypothetical protein
MSTLNPAGTQSNFSTHGTITDPRQQGVKGNMDPYQASGVLSASPTAGHSILPRDSANITITGQPGTYDGRPAQSVGGTGTGIAGTDKGSAGQGGPEAGVAIKLVDGTVQRSTDPMLISGNVPLQAPTAGAVNEADNFLMSVASQFNAVGAATPPAPASLGIPLMNDAQSADAGLSGNDNE